MLNKIIEAYFLKKNYGIVTPGTQNFGAFYVSLNWGLKAIKYKKLKLILCIPLINKNNDFKSFLNPYGKMILFKILVKLPVKQILYSMLLTLLYNLFSIIHKYMIRKKISEMNIGKYFLSNLGYQRALSNDAQRYLQIDNYSKLKDVNIDISPFISSFPRLANKTAGKNVICFHVKDLGFNKKKPITLNNIADINNTKSALNSLFNKKYYVIRVGDDSANIFKYKNNDYLDTTKYKKNFEILNYTFSISDFYFGTSGSVSEVAEIYNKRKYIFSSVEYLKNENSFNYTNTVIFKKLISRKEKKILSIEEIFEKQLQHYLIYPDNTNNDYVLIENSKEEILSGLDYFLKNRKGNFKKSILLQDYEDIRRKSNLRLNKEISKYDVRYYKDAFINIPETYLKKYLFQNDELAVESVSVLKKLNL